MNLQSASGERRVIKSGPLLGCRVTHMHARLMHTHTHTHTHSQAHVSLHYIPDQVKNTWIRKKLWSEKHENPSTLGHAATCIRTQSHILSSKKKLITIIFSHKRNTDIKIHVTPEADREFLCTPFTNPYNQTCVHSYQPLCLTSWCPCILNCRPLGSFSSPGLLLEPVTQLKWTLKDLFAGEKKEAQSKKRRWWVCEKT